MNRNLSIACLQYSSSENEKYTLETIKDLIYKALEAKVEFITLPECATSLQKNSSLTKKFAKTEDENFSLQTLKAIAKLNSIFILIGSLPIKAKDKLVNRSFLVGPKGDILYKYDKLYDESNTNLITGINEMCNEMKNIYKKYNDIDDEKEKDKKSYIQKNIKIINDNCQKIKGYLKQINKDENKLPEDIKIIISFPEESKIQQIKDINTNNLILNTTSETPQTSQYPPMFLYTTNQITGKDDSIRFKKFKNQKGSFIILKNKDAHDKYINSDFAKDKIKVNAL